MTCGRKSVESLINCLKKLGFSGDISRDFRVQLSAGLATPNPRHECMWRKRKERLG